MIRIDLRPTGRVPSFAGGGGLLVALFLLLNASCVEEEADLKIGKKVGAYTPVACSSSSWTTIPAGIGIDRFQPKSLYNASHYAMRTSTPYWPILFSQNVREVWPEFSRFILDSSGGDKLHLAHKYGTNIWTYTNSPGTFPPPVQTKGGVGASYLLMRWETDYNGTEEGFEIENFRVKCAATPPTPANNVYVHPNAPHDGFFTGAGDVIWVHTTQPANQTMSFYLQPIRGDISTDADFDLYVSTTDPLTPNGGTPPYDMRSTAGQDRPEMVIVPPSSTSRTLYVGLVSWQGSGRFRFYANAHTASLERDYAVVTNFTPTSQQRTTIKNSLYKVAAMDYFATDGRHLISSFDIHYNTSCASVGAGVYRARHCIEYHGDQITNMCLTGSEEDDGCFWAPLNWGGHTVVTALNWCKGGANSCLPSQDPTCTCLDTDEHHRNFGITAVHELGHCAYGFTDEDDTQNPQGQTCGHSVMASGYPAENELVRNALDYCTWHNGGLNSWPGTTGHPASENNWGCLESMFPSNPAMNLNLTPDPFWGHGYIEGSSYSDYPFSRHISLTETFH